MNEVLVAEPYIASSEGEAVWLVHRRHKLEVLTDDRRRAVFVFPSRTEALLSDVGMYHSGAVACALDLAKAARIVAKLAQQARHQRHAWEDRIGNGRNTPTTGPTVNDDTKRGDVQL